MTMRPTRKLITETQAGAGNRQFAGGARALRRGRRDHALELSAASDHGEGRAGAGRRMHGGAEAERSRAAQRVSAGRSLRVDRIARGRAQHRHRIRTGGRAKPSRRIRWSTWSASPDRVRAGKRVGALAGGVDQESDARAGRQIRVRGARRCSVRKSHPGRRAQCDAEFRTDLLGVDPHDGAAQPLSGSAGSGRAGHQRA